MYPAKCDGCSFCQDGCCTEPQFPDCYADLMKEILSPAELEALKTI